MVWIWLCLYLVSSLYIGKTLRSNKRQKTGKIGAMLLPTSYREVSDTPASQNLTIFLPREIDSRISTIQCFNCATDLGVISQETVGINFAERYVIKNFYIIYLYNFFYKNDIFNIGRYNNGA